MLRTTWPIVKVHSQPAQQLVSASAEALFSRHRPAALVHLDSLTNRLQRLSEVRPLCLCCCDD